MKNIREWAPWQIAAAAIGVLLLFLLAGYFVVTTLTTAKTGTAVQSTVPANLGSDANKDVLKRLGNFEAPKNLPIITQPLRTPDPNSPSTVNPFSP